MTLRKLAARAAAVLAALAAVAHPTAAETRVQPGLLESVRLRSDAHDVPHVFALTDRDATFALGWRHAQDRFFQMDLLRRTYSGTVAELVGPAGLPSDVQLRTLGLRRAAEASEAVLSAESRAWLGAYARGVNAWLADRSQPLPPEYAALELTRDAIPAWTIVDSVTLAKGLAFGLSFDLEDIDRTVAYIAFTTAGAFAGFDGDALFAEDLYRSEPFTNAVSIPGFLPLASTAPRSATDGRPEYLSARTQRLARTAVDTLSSAAELVRTLTRSDADQGSNWWAVSGVHTESGHPLMANDPHLGLDVPPIFHQAQLRVSGAFRPAMNVFGVSFPGTPVMVQACNPWICWGSTTNPLDVTDVYQEVLITDPTTGLPTHTVFRGQPEPIVIVPQTFLTNQPGNAVPNDLVDAGIGPAEGGLTFLVPRRNMGPLVAIDTSEAPAMGLSVQYTGWGATREVEAFRIWSRATNLDEFREGLQYFDFGSQNFLYTDVEGNIAYFTSGELPLREDLQLLERADGGVPPWMIRDGSGTLRHEWLPADASELGHAVPYRILPADEMPHVVNPASGFLFNANNDPVGVVTDNDPLDQLRPGGGIYYLSPGYAGGFRAERIRELVTSGIAAGPVALDDLARWQADTVLLDAQVLLPHLLAAFDHGVQLQQVGAPIGNELRALATEPAVVEAVDRLRGWDFTTPIGIPWTYCAGTCPPVLPPPPTDEEVAASVATTIYSVWRGQALRAVIDGTLARVGLDGFAPGGTLAMTALRHHLDAFEERQGFGASGLFFFGPTPPVEDPAIARDTVLLGALADALDLLSGPAFAPAFAGSQDQDDYRWGLLHRIVFDHPLGPPFSVPPAGGFQDVAPGLPGIPTDGGFGTVDASAHNPRADSANEFMFGSGPARRFLGELAADGPIAFEVIPGGESGVLGSPHFADQLPLWLANEIKPWAYRPDDVVATAPELLVLQPPD